jgi:hypothetical protein
LRSCGFSFSISSSESSIRFAMSGCEAAASSALQRATSGTQKTFAARYSRARGAPVQVDARTELVIAVEIAERLGISPQRVNVLVSGPGFPKPLGKLGRSSGA